LPAPGGAIISIRMLASSGHHSARPPLRSIAGARAAARPNDHAARGQVTTAAA